MTDSTATGRRLGARSPRLDTKGTSSKAPTSTTGIARMMNVSAPGGLSERRANSHQKGQSGFGLAPSSAGSGRARGTFWSGDRRQDHDHDRRSETRRTRPSKALHRRRERHLLQLLLVLCLVGLGIDDLTWYRRLADPPLEHQPEMHRQEGQQQPRDDEHVQGEEPAQRVAADDRTAQQQIDDVGPTTGTRPAIDAPTPTPQ